MVNPRAVAVANAARADLLDRVGPRRVLVGQPARDAVGLASEGSAEPIAVVRPGGADDVVTILKVGRARHFDVVPRSRLPAIDPENLRNVIVLDTRSLDRAPAIDIGRRVVTVGAGTAVAVIDRAARGARLCLRASLAFDDGASIGALLAVGEPGELGSGSGNLAADVVAATVVTGNGRIARLGGPLLLNQSPWAAGGLPDPVALLVGSEGHMAVLVDVTLRLHPAPWTAWATASLGDDRAAFMGLLSAARRATSKRLVDSVLLQPDGELHVRAASWRGDEDLPRLTEQVSALFERHGVKLSRWMHEQRRERLGYEAGAWPQPTALRGPALTMHVSWPDAAAVHDITRALTSAEGAPPTQTAWALGEDGVKLRCACEGPAQRHPLIAGSRHLLDAGAVPIGAGAMLREAARARMAPSSKILTTALARAFDPDGVLATKSGLL